MSVLRKLTTRPVATILGATALLAVAATAGIIALAPQQPEEGPEAVDCSAVRQPTMQQAGVIADACDIDVEVVGDRTPWEQTWATASGDARLVMTAMPTGTDINGDWEPIDTTVAPEPGADGMLEVVAPVYRMQLNPGGPEGAGEPLATIEHQSHRVALGFPLELPVPTVAGSSVTYAFTDGARLTVYVSADGTGFAPVVELDSPADAAWFEAALTDARTARELPGDGIEVPFALTVSDGLTTVMREGGAFEIVDEDENVVFEAPPSAMWDSAGGMPAPASEATPSPSPTVVEGEHADTPRVRGQFPWPLDNVTLMAVRSEDSTIVVTPDADMLSDPATVWPVRIDPTLNGHGASEWTMLRTGGFTSSVYKFTDISSGYPGGGMGRCNEASCNATYTARLVWEFGGMAAVRNAVGADISSAKFDVLGVHSYNCTARKADLHITGAISSASTWSSVSWSTEVGTRTDAHRESCDNVRRVEYNALTALRKFADEDLTTITLGLKADDETTMLGWKRFENDAKLDITYNRPPNTPTGLAINSPSFACASGASAPYLKIATPTFVAKATDPDGEPVAILFRVLNVATAAIEWGVHTAEQTGGTSLVSAAVPAGTLENNVRYKYIAYGYDGVRYSTPTSTACEFFVDTTPPPTPVISPQTTGVQAVYVTGKERGGVGLAGAFTATVGAGSNVKDISYTAGPNSGTVTPDANGTISFPFTPNTTGPVTVTVTAKSRAGLTKAATYTVDVAGAREGALWTLDDVTGTTAPDTSGVPALHPLTLVGAATAEGPHALFQSRTGDKALSFNGTSARATTDGPIIDTQSSFTVSAFVKLNAGTTPSTRTAVSQDGLQTSGFQLGTRSGCTGSQVPSWCWAFTMPNSDSTSATVTTVSSTTSVVNGEWVHLVADHTASTGAMRLWVCKIGTPAAPERGIPEQSQATRSGTRSSVDGDFVVGRGRSAATDNAWWPGLVDNVRVFPGQVVADSKIRRMCQGAEAMDFAGSAAALDPTTTEGQ